jgi:hypothetical protein
MIKKCLPVLFLFQILFLYAGDFDDLYSDLENYWLLGRNSIYCFDLNQTGHAYFTKNKLDFHINGFGFFVVVDDTNNVEYLTRNGRFLYNVRGFLVNEDGYYVLNSENGFIYRDEIDLEQRYFEEFFLVVFPGEDTGIIVSDKYITAAQIKRLDNVKVTNEFLEMMPVSLDSLLTKALPDIPTNKDYPRKDALIALIYKRYHEMKKLNAVSSEYYAALWKKIELFVKQFHGIQLAGERHHPLKRPFSDRAARIRRFTAPPPPVRTASFCRMSRRREAAP